LVGDRKPFPVVRGQFAADEGQFSPDGRWIAYRSTESGREEIYVQPFPGPGGEVQISVLGGSHPRWRRDGKELFYIASAHRMMAVPISLPAETGPSKVGTPVPLFATPLAGMSFPKQNYAVAPDGQRFLMNVAAADATTAPITLVVNWPAALKK